MEVIIGMMMNLKQKRKNDCRKRTFNNWSSKDLEIFELT